jgi:hypothetical protein
MQERIEKLESINGWVRTIDYHIDWEVLYSEPYFASYICIVMRAFNCIDTNNCQFKRMSYTVNLTLLLTYALL